MKKKRGPCGLSPVSASLLELLKHPCPDGFFPWNVEVFGNVVYCYARNAQDAIKKIMNHIAKASPCNLQAIIEAAPKQSETFSENSKSNS